MAIQAVYVGNRFVEWEMEGRKGVYTEVYLIKKFPMGTQNASGNRVVVEKVRADLRKDFEAFVSGQVVQVEYDSDLHGKSVLAEMIPAVDSKTGATIERKLF